MRAKLKNKIGVDLISRKDEIREEVKIRRGGEDDEGLVPDKPLGGSDAQSFAPDFNRLKRTNLVVKE